MKILMTCTDLQTTGITAVIMNLTRYFSYESIKVEIAAGSPVYAEYAEELEKRGVTVHGLPSRRKNTLAYRKALKKLIKENGYDAVHVHGNSSTMVLELAVAKKYGVPVRIAHCHNSVCGSMLRHRLLYPFFKKSYTHAFACSELAGEWIFGKGNFTVIPNGVVARNFVFGKEKRESLRKELGISDNLVIGHVGRFNDQKNHGYLLKVFEKVSAVRPEARLLLVGNGPDFEQTKALIESSPYSDKVTVYGETNDVAGLMSAMDVFAFPSKFEGLGIVCVEAQINGLPVICSENCPKDIALTDLVRYIGLEDTESWINALSAAEISARDGSEEYLKAVVAAGYSGEAAAEKLEKLYLDFFKK